MKLSLHPGNSKSVSRIKASPCPSTITFYAQNLNSLTLELESKEKMEGPYQENKDGTECVVIDLSIMNLY